MENSSTAQSEGPAFSYLRLLWSNLGVHPIRSGLSAVAVGLQVFLILLIVGLTSGVLRDWRTRAEGVGADIIVQPPNSSIFFSLSSAVMPQTLVDDIAKLPGIAQAAGVLLVVDTDTLTVIYGVEYDRFSALSDGFKFLAGGPLMGPNDVLSDDLAAQARKLRVGGTVTLMNHEFDVRGIVMHGKGARYFIQLPTAQDIAGAEDRVSMIYVRSAGDTGAARAEIEKLLPTYKIRSMSEYTSLMTSANLPELQPFINSFIGLGVVISFLVTLLTMYTMVLERRREIGVLKALGASQLEICRLIVAEALMLVAIGVVVGVAATFIVTSILQRTSPTLQIEITPDWIARSIVVAIAGAIAGAAYPALRAAQADPVEALAVE